MVRGWFTETTVTDKDRLSEDTIYRLLSNDRRRRLLRFLLHREEPASVSELATRIAAWENDVPPDAVSYKERKSVYNSLYQNHLGQLAEAGVIEAERRWEGIELTERVHDIKPYLSNRSLSVSWETTSFFALSLVELALLAGVWLELPIVPSPSASLGPTVVLLSMLFMSVTTVALLSTSSRWLPTVHTPQPDE